MNHTCNKYNDPLDGTLTHLSTEDLNSLEEKLRIDCAKGKRAEKELHELNKKSCELNNTINSAATAAVALRNVIEECSNRKQLLANAKESKTFSHLTDMFEALRRFK